MQPDLHDRLLYGLDLQHAVASDVRGRWRGVRGLRFGYCRYVFAFWAMCMRNRAGMSPGRPLREWRVHMRGHLMHQRML